MLISKLFNIIFGPTNYTNTTNSQRGNSSYGRTASSGRRTMTSSGRTNTRTSNNSYGGGSSSYSRNSNTNTRSTYTNTSRGTNSSSNTYGNSGGVGNQRTNNSNSSYSRTTKDTYNQSAGSSSRTYGTAGSSSKTKTQNDIYDTVCVNDNLCYEEKLEYNSNTDFDVSLLPKRNYIELPAEDYNNISLENKIIYQQLKEKSKIKKAESRALQSQKRSRWIYVLIAIIVAFGAFILLESGVLVNIATQVSNMLS